LLASYFKVHEADPKGVATNRHGEVQFNSGLREESFGQISAAANSIRKVLCFAVLSLIFDRNHSDYNCSGSVLFYYLSTMVFSRCGGWIR